MSIPDAAESKRQDQLTAYTSTILNRLSGDELERVLVGEVKRRGRTDSALRKAALDNVHPDDLVAALVKAGYSLKSFGIESIKLDPSLGRAGGLGMYAPFNRFEIQMTKDQTESVSQSGKDAAEDVRQLMRDPKIKRQLKKLDPVAVRAELAEYGAWDDEQLADHDENLQRILWIAGGNITEEAYQSRRGRGLRGPGLAARPSFEQSARSVLAAVKAGDCDAAKIATAKAIYQAKTPHQRDVVYKLQQKVRSCTIKGLGRARRRRN